MNKLIITLSLGFLVSCNSSIERKEAIKPLIIQDTIRITEKTIDTVYIEKSDKDEFSLTVETKEYLESNITNNMRVDSIEFFLTDTITKEFWFDHFKLVLYKNRFYNFNFAFWGGYRANEFGTFRISNDTLVLTSDKGTNRIMTFKKQLSESDFYTESDILKSKYLEVFHLNIDE